MLSLILDAGAAGTVFRMIGTAVYASALLLTAADIPAATTAADIPAAATTAADISAATDIEGTPGIIVQPTTIWMGVPISAAALCLNAQPTTV